MKRIFLSAASCLLTLATAQGQMPGQPQPGEGASVAHAVPLSYVGGSGRVSIGIDNEGNSTGEALGVFDNTGEHAWIGQLWWGHGGAGGVQMGYNWLWGGMTLSQANAHPERVTVARTMVAIDQNEFRDRKATIGFGIERPNYFIDAYLSAAASGSRNGGTRSIADDTLLLGNDAIGSYTQVETVTTIEGFASSAYDSGIGLRAGHFSDLLAGRIHAGLDYQWGRGGAHVLTTSIGVDKYLGTRGWSLSGLVEHDESSTDPMLGTSSDLRTSLFLRYEFGGRVFAPTSELASAAWIARAVANPPSAHPRTVQTYTRRTTQATEREVSPKHYTNLNPVATDDVATAAAGGAAILIDVLANDRDGDGDPLSVIAVTPAAHATTALAGNRVSYTPAADFDGSDAFSYTISDGRGGTATAGVTISVTTHPNRPPVARDDGASTRNGVPVHINVLANDSDPDGDPITVTRIGQPSHGTATPGGDGGVTYTPAAGFEGSDGFTYSIEDGRGGTASARVTIAVTPQPNLPPTARDDVATASVGASVVIHVLANDSDPDGDPLVLVSVGQPAHGSAQRNGDGSVTYTPDPQFVGNDDFSYVVGDGRGGQASASVHIQVLAAPNQPPVAVDDAASVSAGGSVDVDVLANDSDPDGDALSVVATTQGQYGSVAIQPDGSVRYTWVDLAASGVDQFSYTIDDGRGGSATATVHIQLLPAPNQPPVAVDDVASAPSDNSLLIIPVLDNDSDPDGDALTVISTGMPLYGNVTILANGTLAYARFAGMPVQMDTFSYVISDGRGGQATAMVTVLPPDDNQPPVAGDDAFGVPFDNNGVLLDVLANDSDPDGDALQLTAVGPPSAGIAYIEGNQVRFIPADLGTFQFTYTISDGNGGSATAHVEVTVFAP